MPDVDNAKGEKSFGKLHVKLFVLRALKAYMYVNFVQNSKSE